MTRRWLGAALLLALAATSAALYFAWRRARTEPRGSEPEPTGVSDASGPPRVPCEGEIPHDTLREVLASHHPAVSECGKRYAPDFEGVLRVTLRVEATGDVGEIATEGAADAPALDDCVRRELASLRLPPMAGCALVSLPMVFSGWEASNVYPRPDPSCTGEVAPASYAEHLADWRAALATCAAPGSEPGPNVYLTVEVDPAGEPLRVGLASPALPPAFEECAHDAVRRWRFEADAASPCRVARLRIALTEAASEAEPAEEL